MHKGNRRAANHLSVSHSARMERKKDGVETLSVGTVKKSVWKSTIIETDGDPWQRFEGKTRGDVKLNKNGKEKEIESCLAVPFRTTYSTPHSNQCVTYDNVSYFYSLQTKLFSS